MSSSCFFQVGAQMTLSINALLGKKGARPSVRCIVATDVSDASSIGRDIRNSNVVIFSIRDLRMANPMDARKLIHQVKAYSLEYGASLATLGNDFLLVVPPTHELTVQPIAQPSQ